MKKRLALVLAVALLAMALMACGKEEEVVAEPTPTPAPTEEVKEEVVPAVTLGEYKGLEVNYTEPFVAEEDVEAYALQEFTKYITEEVGIKDRAVEEGDKVYLSYEGKIDGVAFDGGTSAGYMLEIGSGTFIPGFEDQLIGAMPGDTVDVVVTFPENYSATDLAGKEAVFTCEVFYIVPEMNDEVVALLDWDYKTVDELKDSIRNDMLAQMQTNVDAEIENNIVEAVINNATFGEIPEDLIDRYKLTVDKQLEAYTAYGYDKDTVAQMLYGTDAATMIDELSLMYAKQDLVFHAVAEKEGLKLDDAALDVRLAKYAKENGFEKAEDIITEDMTKEQYRDFFLFDDVITYLTSNNKAVPAK